LDQSEIPKMVEGMERETKKIKEEIYRISWAMRGGVTSHDLFHYYSHEDRVIMDSIIEKNVEITRKSGINII
jgi:hypothetical protein